MKKSDFDKILKGIEDVSKLIDEMNYNGEMRQAKKYGVSLEAIRLFHKRKIARIKELQASGMSLMEAKKICDKMRP